MCRATAIALAFVVGVGVSACNSNAPDPSSKAENALKQANLSDVKVDWDKDARIAHLKGTVDTPTDRDRAEQVATTAVGTSGKVLNEVTVKGMTEKSADDRDGQIRDSLKQAVDNDPVLKDRDVDFDVNNGVVTVKGDVRTASEKAKVTELVRSVPGVKDFANALEVKPSK
jgi:osmotically-inducible protein OsmY